MNPTDPIMIGRAEMIDFPELNYTAVPARIDTGAKTSSIWASSTREENGVLYVIFFGADSAFHSGGELRFDEYDTAVVASSTGEARERYKVRLLVKVGGRRIRAWFTLADRSTQAYPVLIGRNVLRGKFVVDVAQGTVARDAERQRTQTLRAVTQPENEENV